MYHSYAMQVHGYVSPSSCEEGDHFILVHGVRFSDHVELDVLNRCTDNDEISVMN